MQSDTSRSSQDSNCVVVRLAIYSHCCMSVSCLGVHVHTPADEESSLKSEVDANVMNSAEVANDSMTSHVNPIFYNPLLQTSLVRSTLPHIDVNEIEIES